MSGRCWRSDPTAQQIVGQHEMPDASSSVHPPAFDYDHTAYRDSAATVKAWSRGRCRLCGRRGPLQAHHYAARYPPAHQTSPRDLTALCRDCHDDTHHRLFLLRAGGSREQLRVVVSEAVAALLLHPDTGRLRSLLRAGRAVWCDGSWAAIVTGASRPRVGEVFLIFLRSTDEWRTVVVTEVLGGRPGSWRVRKRFLDGRDAVEPMMVHSVRAEQRRPTATRRGAA